MIANLFEIDNTNTRNEGYIKISNLLIQWGYLVASPINNTSELTFKIPFKNSTAPTMSAFIRENKYTQYHISSIETTYNGAKIYSNVPNSLAVGMHWFAIGFSE